MPGMPWGGSIPACAGEPFFVKLGEGEGKVYPRVCGGTSGRNCAGHCGVGLSPRVRGNLVVQLGYLLQGGSIPACAGEPFLFQRVARRHRVYPRVCGGTFGFQAGEALHNGLSPRVRGNPRAHAAKLAGLRSISACAGEPHRGGSHFPSLRVYPRVCGGTPKDYPLRDFGDGLSPRVRGNQGHLRQRVAAGGSIPACAGEPRL